MSQVFTFDLVSGHEIDKQAEMSLYENKVLMVICNILSIVPEWSYFI